MSKKKIWIDCDPGIDDSLALLYALKSDAFEIMGISVTTGNTTAENGFNNLCRVFDVLNYEPTFPIGWRTTKCAKLAEDTHGANGLGNYNPPFKKYKRAVNISETMEDVFKKQYG